jgi:hypothetical protein
VQLLADDAVPLSHKHLSLRYLESLADRIPPEVQEQLIPIATRIARREVPETHNFLGNARDAAGEATNLILALGAVDPDASADRLVDLLAGSPADRRWAARVAARTEGPDRLGLLVTLAADTDPSVRVAAAPGLATAVAPASPDLSPSAPSRRASPTPALPSRRTPPPRSEPPEERPPMPSSRRCASTPQRTSAKPQRAPTPDTQPRLPTSFVSGCGSRSDTVSASTALRMLSKQHA